MHLLDWREKLRASRPGRLRADGPPAAEEAMAAGPGVEDVEGRSYGLVARSSRPEGDILDLSEDVWTDVGRERLEGDQLDLPRQQSL